MGGLIGDALNFREREQRRLHLPDRGTHCAVKVLKVWWISTSGHVRVLAGFPTGAN
jgi:hypothetical protein